MSHEHIEGMRAIGTVGYLGGIMAIPEPFCWSMIQLVQFNTESLCEPGQYVHYTRATVSLHDIARNALVADMRGDWLLMLDADLSFAPDVCARLLRVMMAYDLDVVSAIYPYKNQPTIPVMSAFNEDTKTGQNIIDWDRSFELFKFYAGGGGCLLVRRRVFDRIEKELHETAFSRRGAKGEDFSFFDRCRELNIDCWCAWRIDVGHLDYQEKRIEQKNLNRGRFPFAVRETVGIGQI